MDNEKKYNNESYTKIPNKILEALLRVKLQSYEIRVLLAVVRKTYGFNKSRDLIKQRQLVILTGIHKQNIHRAVKSLVKKNILIKTGKVLEIQKDFKLWKVPERIDLKKLSDEITFNDLEEGKKLSDEITGVISRDYKKLSDEITTKKRKKTIQRKYIHTPANKGNHITQIEEIIDYLNDKTGKNFRSKNKKTMEKITARLGEGYNLDDFKKVINIKTAKWKDTEFDDYLRPETLFGGKFENYLNEKEIKNAKSKKYEYQKDYTEDERRKIVEGFYS
jgi:phage replication O-like protein O